MGLIGKIGRQNKICTLGLDGNDDIFRTYFVTFVSRKRFDKIDIRYDTIKFKCYTRITLQKGHVGK